MILSHPLLLVSYHLAHLLTYRHYLSSRISFRQGRPSCRRCFLPGIQSESQLAFGPMPLPPLYAGVTHQARRQQVS
uniref:Uncharacterized protein n=1 Tax=Cannabis sativa TaxID=3483 RepID=A0A803QV37_CANSA